MDCDALIGPEKEARWGFIGTLLWGLLVAVVFVIVQLGVLVVYMAFNYAQLTRGQFDAFLSRIETNGNVLFLSIFATSIICGGMVLGAIKLKRGSNLRAYLGWKGFDLKTAGYWFGALSALILLSELLTMVLNRPVVPDMMAQAYSSAYSPALVWLAIIAAAPLFEEIFFRGFLLPGFASSFIRPAGAVIVTSALWALMHLQYDLYGIMTIFILGLLLGAARLVSGSVLLTIALHAFSNLVSTIETMSKISN